MLGKSHNAHNHDSPLPSGGKTGRLKLQERGSRRIRLLGKDLQSGESLRASLGDSKILRRFCVATRDG